MFKRAFRMLWNNERGNILILVAAAMPLLIGAAGLATDTIQWALWKRELQRAADSAAIAGVYERNITPLGATTGVPAAVTRDLALNQHAGTLFVDPELAYPNDVTSPVERTNQVSVTLKVSRDLSFSSFFMKTPPVITAHSTAASVPGAGEYCVIALDQRNITGFDIGGSTTVDLGQCCMIANSTSANDAFTNTGNASSVVAGCIAAAGGVKYSTSANWQVGGYYPYSDAAADPFSAVTVPAPGACTKHDTFGKMIQSDIDRSTAAYADTGHIVCIAGGFDIKANLKLGNATYVIETTGENDDLSMSVTNASLSCDSCTIILTNRSDPTKTGNIKLTGGTLNLNAPTASVEAYQGIALYQDRLAADDNKTGANHVNGGSGAGVQGVIYMPGRSLLYNGGASVKQVGKCMQIVAKRVSFSGNSKLAMGSACLPAGLHGYTGGGSLVRLVA